MLFLVEIRILFELVLKENIEVSKELSLIKIFIIFFVIIVLLLFLVLDISDIRKELMNIYNFNVIIRD